MSANDQFARSLGPDAYDSPVFPCESHPFFCVEGNPYCGRCGGGLLHEIHAAPVLLDEAA
jgi:hypothetical protein